MLLVLCVIVLAAGIVLAWFMYLGGAGERPRRSAAARST